jgi:hypothetical protein
MAVNYLVRVARTRLGIMGIAVCILSATGGCYGNMSAPVMPVHTATPDMSVVPGSEGAANLAGPPAPDSAGPPAANLAGPPAPDSAGPPPANLASPPAPDSAGPPPVNLASPPAPNSVSQSHRNREASSPGTDGDVLPPGETNIVAPPNAPTFGPDAPQDVNPDYPVNLKPPVLPPAASSQGSTTTITKPTCQNKDEKTKKKSPKCDDKSTANNPQRKK